MATTYFQKVGLKAIAAADTRFGTYLLELHCPSASGMT